MVDALLAALIETWTLYTGGSLIIFARIYCRWRMVGIHNFKPDDYLIVFAWITYTGMTVAAHLVGGHGDLGAIPTDQRLSLTPEQRASLILGTKWFMVGWYTYVSFIWTMKINMLFLYQRVVNGLWVAKFIKPAMALVVATYVSIIILVSVACRPYNRMWQVWPDPGKVCKAQTPVFLIPTLVCNLVTDLCIMAIPAPVILPLKTTVWRRIGLYILFGAGVFVMTAAVLRVVFVLGLKNGKTAAIWSCREDIVAIFVGQATMIRPIFTRKFWSGGYGPGSTGVSGHGGGGHGPSKDGQVSFELADGTIGGSGARKKSSSGFRRKDPYATTTMLATLQEGDSTEKIIDTSGSGSVSGTSGAGDVESGSAAAGKTGALVINVSNDVDVESVECGSGPGDRRYRESLRPGDAHGWTNQHGYGTGYAGRA